MDYYENRQDNYILREKNIYTEVGIILIFLSFSLFGWISIYLNYQLVMEIHFSPFYKFCLWYCFGIIILYNLIVLTVIIELLFKIFKIIKLFILDKLLFVITIISICYHLPSIVFSSLLFNFFVLKASSIFLFLILILMISSVCCGLILIIFGIFLAKMTTKLNNKLIS